MQNLAFQSAVRNFIKSMKIAQAMTADNRTDAKRDRKPDPIQDPFYNLEENVASATECTGLSPTPAQDDAQARALAELYSVHRQKPNYDERRDS